MWVSLVTAGKNGGECSMEGEGLRAEGETMDGRELTPSGMGMLRWPRGSRRRFFYGISGVLSSRTATLDAL